MLNGTSTELDTIKQVLVQIVVRGEELETPSSRFWTKPAGNVVVPFCHNIQTSATEQSKVNQFLLLAQKCKP